MARSDREPWLAAVLSLIVPGVGQIYAGHLVWGLVWLVLTPGFWLGTGGMLGWVCHLLSAWQAHSQAKSR